MLPGSTSAVYIYGNAPVMDTYSFLISCGNGCFGLYYKTVWYSYTINPESTWYTGTLQCDAAVGFVLGWKTPPVTRYRMQDTSALQYKSTLSENFATAVVRLNLSGIR